MKCPFNIDFWRSSPFNLDFHEIVPLSPNLGKLSEVQNRHIEVRNRHIEVRKAIWGVKSGQNQKILFAWFMTH